jgi:tRNA dimethylallyltransferase
LNRPPGIFIIAGPTAVGKSEAAVKVAELCGGEIVSADAFQVYKGLDILTAKPAPELRARVPHHLIGEIPLEQSFDVAQFLRLAQARIADIRGRSRVPIIVGGTGLYLRALTHGLADLPPADAALRTHLEAQTSDDLNEQLAKRDPVSHARIDLQNRRRVVRALEVCLLTNRPFSSFRQEWSAPAISADGVVLNRPRELLYHRIDRRTEEMFDAGVVREVSEAGALGPTASQTLGWREIQGVLRGEMSRGECVAAIQQTTRRYAKRQMTWFRREKHLEFVDLGSADPPPALIEQWARRASATTV